jgi:hypothetical protein
MDKGSFLRGTFLTDIKQRPGRPESLYHKIADNWKKGFFFGVSTTLIWELFTFEAKQSSADAVAIPVFYELGEKCLVTPLRWLHRKLVEQRIIPPSNFFVQKQPYIIYKKEEDNSDGCSSCNHGCSTTKTLCICPAYNPYALAMISLDQDIPLWGKEHPGHCWYVKFMNCQPSHEILAETLLEYLDKDTSNLILQYLPESKLSSFHLTPHVKCKLSKIKRGSIHVLDEVHLRDEDMDDIIEFFLPGQEFNIRMRLKEEGRIEIRQ